MNIRIIGVFRGQKGQGAEILPEEITDDGGRIGQGDHFLPHKFIKRTFEAEQTPQNNF